MYLTGDCSATVDSHSVLFRYGKYSSEWEQNVSSPNFPMKGVTLSLVLAISVVQLARMFVLCPIKDLKGIIIILYYYPHCVSLILWCSMSQYSIFLKANKVMED